MITVITIEGKVRATYASDIWLGCRIIRVQRKIETSTLQLEATRAATITCSDKNSLALGSSLLEELIFLIDFLLTHILLAIAPTDTDDRRTILDNTRKFIIIALCCIWRLINDQFCQVGSLTQDNFHVKFNFDGACARLSIKTIKHDILNRNASTTKAL